VNGVFPIPLFLIMRRVALLFVASALVSLACAGSGAAVGANTPATTKVVAVEQDFDLSPGQTAVVDGGALTVSFEKVSEDSRCPTGVQCIWAGNGAVTLTATTPSSGKHAVTLNTTLTPHSARAGTYEVSLIGLNPYPTQGSRIDPASYVVTLHVIRQ
jgi:hypothetical protein